MKIIKTLVLLILITSPVSGQVTYDFNRVDWLEKQLNIPNIETNEEIIDMRLFIGTGITNGGHVIRISKRNNNWSAKKYDYFIEILNDSLTGNLELYSITTLNSDNWQNMWSNLEQLGVLTLPDQSEIKDQLRKKIETARGEAYMEVAITDGILYNLIVKKDLLSNRFSFWNPWFYQGYFPEVEELKKYAGIITILESEFGVALRH